MAPGGHLQLQRRASREREGTRFAHSLGHVVRNRSAPLVKGTHVPESSSGRRNHPREARRVWRPPYVDREERAEQATGTPLLRGPGGGYNLYARRSADARAPVCVVGEALVNLSVSIRSMDVRGDAVVAEAVRVVVRACARTNARLDRQPR